MTTQRIMTVGAAALLLLLTACSSPLDDTSPTSNDSLPAPAAGLSRVILVGDSVAAGESAPLSAAFGAAGIEFSSMASDGGGNVVGPNAESTWDAVTERLDSAKPSTVIYQITSYDWGTPVEQRAAYERLVSEVHGAGAKLVMVTMPPIVADDFYEPHLTELESAATVAGEVAGASSGNAVLLDASEVWGDEYEQLREGKADRSSDGIHTCPQGAARFTNWLLKKLAEQYPSFAPPEPAAWANTGWASDDHFVGC